MICPKCGATRLIIHCTEQAAAALAEGADDWADAWADLAARIRGTDTFHDEDDDHKERAR